MPTESLTIDADSLTNNPTYWSTTTTGTTGTYPITRIAMSPSNLTWTVGQGVEKEYVEKLEKHIDELEEDIEYFNNKLEEKDATIYTLQHQVTELDKANKTFEAHITYLEGRLQSLEDKINK